MRVENMRDVHFFRNPRIARVMNDFGFVQELGEGVDRIYDEMASLGLPPPTFREREGSLILTLENDIVRRQQAPNHTAPLWTSLTTDQQRLLVAMASREAITPRQAETITGRSRPAVLRYLNDLVQKGLVVRRASAPNDPSTTYAIAGSSLAEEIKE